MGTALILGRFVSAGTIGSEEMYSLNDLTR